MYRLWKDEETDLRWDQFSWDEVVPDIISYKNMKPLKTGLRKKKDNGVVQLVNSIVTGATGDATLDNPPITLAALTTLGTELATAITEEQQAKDTLLNKRETRRAKSRAAKHGIRLYAGHAYLRYEGDAVKLAALGLSVSTPGLAQGVLPAPTNLRSRPGKANNCVDLFWKAVPNRESHELQMAEDVNGPWTEVYRGKKSRACSSNLVPGKLYFFRVRAYGAFGAGTWSDITSARAS
jgi:hypothetical protein